MNASAYPIVRSIVFVTLCFLASQAANAQVSAYSNACLHDSDGNGSIDLVDLLSFLASFGEACAASPAVIEVIPLAVPQPHVAEVTCSGSQPANIILFNGAVVERFNFVNTQWTLYEDGSASISGHCVSHDEPNAGYAFLFRLVNLMDWQAWSTQAFPSSYRDDCNLVGNGYQSWQYYLLSSDSYLEGWGLKAGSFLEVSHAPANLYYAFQVGEGASNENTLPGGGGWFLFSESEGQANAGSGSLYFDFLSD